MVDTIKYISLISPESNIPKITKIETIIHHVLLNVIQYEITNTTIIYSWI